MAKSNMESGFTIVEMIVSMVVMSIFLTLFFQTFLTNESQRKVVFQQASVEDLVTANLAKVSSKSTYHNAAHCNSTSNVTANDELVNLDNPSHGRIIATDRPGVSNSTPRWSNDTGSRPNSTIAKEDTAGKGLPNGLIQELRVLFPRGCDPQTPMTVVSIAEYASGGITETVRRAVIIND